MSKCANKSDDNYKRLNKLIGNENAISMVWEHLDGAVGNINTKEEFNTVLKKAMTSKAATPVAELKTGDTQPLSKFSFDQKNELVDNLIFLAVWDSENQALKDVENISFKDIEARLRAQQVSNPSYSGNYDEVLKKENLDELVAKAQGKLESLGVVPDSEEDPDNKSEGASYQESYLIKNIDKARTNVKLMVAFLPEEELGTTLGLRKFNNFNKSWNDLENLLSNTVASKGQTDKMPHFLEQLSKEGIYKPQYRFLKKILENSTEQKRTQFQRALDNYKIVYTSTIIETKDRGVGGYDTKIINSDSMSNANRVLMNWDSNFQELFIQEKKGVPTAKNASAARAVKDYTELRKKALASNTITFQDKENALNLMNSIGMPMSPKALEEFLNTTKDSQLESLKHLYRNTLSYVFVGTKFSKNTLTDLANNKVERTGAFVVSPILDESNLLPLSEVQQKYENNLTSNSILGPEGKMFQTISQYDYVTKKIVELNNDDAYLFHLEDSYTTNSYYIDYFKNNPEARKSLKLHYFNSRKSAGEDAGVGINKTSEVDEFADRVERVLKGQIPYLTLADKNRLYYLEGLPTDNIKRAVISDNVLDRFVGYFADEMISMRKAWEDVYGENPIPQDQQLLNYHYKINKEGNRVPGNAFTSTLMPSLSPGAPLAEDLGLYSKIDNNKPFIISPTYISEDNGEISIEPGFKDLVAPHLKGLLENKIEEMTNEMLEKLVSFDENGNVVHTSFSSSTWNNIINKYNDKKLGVAIIATNYVVNTLTANIEYTKMFTGDPRKFKSIEDYSKRVPATSSTGDYLRLGPGVNTSFNIAVAPNIIENSDFLYNDAHRANIKEFVEAKTSEEKKAIDDILDSYAGVNRTDAQAWITMDRFKEILVGLGEWNEDVMSPAFTRIKKGTATAEDYTIFSKKMTTMQPKKGVHFELIKHRGELVPVYLKYSQAILFPELISTSPALAKIAQAMEEQEVSELIVGDGVKVGAIEATDIAADEITFNKLRLSNKEWKLQQDLPSKEKDTLVGSQIKKNILADIDLEADYEGTSGEEIVKSVHRMDGELSNRGYQKVLKKLGITDQGVNTEKLYDSLSGEFESEDESKNLLDALKQRIPLDFILSHRQVIFNKINSIFNKDTVKIKQPGGSAIQLSNYGFDAGSRFKTFDKASSSVKNGITWLQAENELKPPRVERNEKGDTVFKPGQVLLPYNRLAALFGDRWDSIKNLPYSDIVAKIDKEALMLVGYRIPNQKLASNDSLEIVGILPPQGGSTIIAYAEITTKTGSDFDIDKMYYIQPALNPKLVKGRVEVVKFLDDSNSTVEERYATYINEIKFNKDNRAATSELLKEARVSVTDARAMKTALNSSGALKDKLTSILGLDSTDDIVDEILREEEVIPTRDNFSSMSIEGQNTTAALQTRRVDLYRKVLESKHSFSRLISTVDADWLVDQINRMLPKKKMTDLELFSGSFQMGQRREFIASKGGVGQVANQQVDHAISQWGEKYLVDPSGRIDSGNLTVEGHLDLSKIYNTEGANITEVISAYMNAFVDAAKDNYIGRANFNNQTNNSAFLLIRNGVSPFFVNAFLSQPSIKRYVELTNIKEGQAVPVNTKKPLDIVLEELGVSKEAYDKMNSSLSQYDTKSLETSASAGFGESEEQANILNLFLHVQDMSKALGKSVIASKADTKGSGVNLMDAIIIDNLKENVSNEGRIGNWEEMFHKEGVPTMLGSYHNNSVKAVVENVSPMSILGTEGMKYVVNDIYSKIWGRLPDDASKANRIYQLAYAALLSNNNAFQLSKEQLSTMMEGDNSIAKRLLRMKDSDKYKDNPMVAMLLGRVGRYENLSYVSLNNAKGRNSKVNEELTESWLELYNNPNSKSFAKDLAVYSFYTSALTDNLSSLYRLTPWQINIDLGLNTDTFNQLKTNLNNEDKSVLAETLTEQVLKNSWNDTRLVPRISNKQAVELKKGAKSEVFGVNDTSSPALKVGMDVLGNPIFKPYITRSLGKKDSDIALYKYVGNVEKESGNGFVSTGVYERVNKLGESKGISKLFEFTVGKVKSSIIAGNNYSHPEGISDYIKSINPQLPLSEYTKEENISSNLDKPKESSNIAKEEQSSLVLNEAEKTAVLKDGNTYKFEDINADVLIDAGYSPEEAGEILIKLCK